MIKKAYTPVYGENTYNLVFRKVYNGKFWNNYYNFL